MNTCTIKILPFLLPLWIMCTCKKPVDPIIAHFNQSGDTLCQHAYLFLKENASPSERLEMKKNKEFIIEDIELAVNNSRDQLTENRLLFDIFCNYILPSRIFHETPGRWRKFYRKHFACLIGQPITVVCDSINNQFKKRFRRCPLLECSLYKWEDDSFHGTRK